MAENARHLVDLGRGDADVFGGKSANLGELLAAGIPVPPGFALSSDAFRAFVAHAGLERKIVDTLGRLAPGDVDALGAASRTIAEAMRSAALPDDVRAEIALRYAELGDDVPVAVRSSALGEDAQDATFAGQQETYLWVRGTEHVCDAVRDCWISLYSPTAIAYRARLADDTEPAMGVTVQLMVDAAVSGVLFTCNPVTGDASMVAINASWGLGLAVVGGDVTPDDFLISKVTRELVREHVHVKEVQYVPDPEGKGAMRIDVPAELRDTRCLDAAALTALVDVAQRIERHFGSHQDVEWAIARGAEPTDGLFVVQSRPVTAARRREAKQPTDALSLVMSTFGANVEPRES
jgi:pyruvate, water dikinase